MKTAFILLWNNAIRQKNKAIERVIAPDGGIDMRCKVPHTPTFIFIVNAVRNINHEIFARELENIFAVKHRDLRRLWVKTK